MPPPPTQLVVVFVHTAPTGRQEKVLQVPLEQVPPDAVQSTHGVPPVPQVVLPLVLQTPDVLQHPLAQVDALQVGPASVPPTHDPAEHVLPVAVQLTHAIPPVPQVVLPLV